VKDAWLDRSPLPTGVIRDGRFVYANQAMLDLVGMPREAFLGQRFLERVAPEDHDRMRDRHARRLRGEPVPVHYEFTLLTGGGERRTVEIWVSTDGGDVVYQLHDRTGRAERQAKLAELAHLGVAVQLEQSEDRVFAALARRLPALDITMVRITPDPRDRSGDAMRVLAVSAPGDRLARFEAAVGRSVKEMAGVLGPAGRIAWRDGSAYLDDVPLATSRFFEGQAALVERARDALFARGAVLRVDLQGQAAELLLLMADWLLPEDLPACRLFGAQISAALDAARLVADLRRSYADLARAQAQLVERERLAAIGELAAVVAHEVRNPLGVLFNSLGALQKLLGARVEGAAATLLGIMDEETTRLNHIVRDLLDFARPATPNLQRERLESIVEEAVDAALHEAKGRVTLVREIRELPPVPVDARLIRQAVINLVDNAAQAMPRGGTITLRVEPDEIDRAKAARIDVTDTGPGIAPDVEHRIFEPFFTTRATGTGLGLAVVKRIVDGHRGRLRVNSVEGRGATFSLWLPLDDDGPRSGRG